MNRDVDIARVNLYSKALKDKDKKKGENHVSMLLHFLPFLTHYFIAKEIDTYIKSITRILIK